MHMSINQRVKDVVDKFCDGNASEFARIIGVNQPAIRDVVGTKQVKPGFDTICRIVENSTYNGRINRKLKRIGKLEVIDNRGTKKYTSLFPGISLYWARHTWASIAARAGVSDDVISQALGHSTTNSTTAIYINRNLQMVDDANRKVLNHLNKKIKVMPPTRLETPPNEVHSYGLII